MSGVSTELQRMQSTATDAARIADELKGAVNRLDAAMGGLSSMDGQIKNVFWQGHSNHLEAVTSLCTRLHRMAEGITVSKNQYESQDGDSQAAFTQLGGTGGALDTSKL